MVRQRFRNSRLADNSRGRSAAAKPPKSKSISRWAKWWKRSSAAALLLLTVTVLLLTVLCYRKWGNNANTASQPSSTILFKRPSSTNVTYQHVLEDAEKLLVDSSHRHLNSTVLAYVTPWNGKGYEMAIKFRTKFTHVSPVWYQLKRVSAELQLFGRHDADQQWISQVRRSGLPLVLPRVLLEASPAELLTKKKERKRAIDLIKSECMNMSYDGVVLEAWSQWAVHGILRDPSLRQKALEFVKELGSVLHKTKNNSAYHENLQFIFVIPPGTTIQKSPDLFTSADLEKLGNYVDGFSLMTYDYSNVYNPGPSAPLPWVHECLHSLLVPSAKGDQKSKELKDLSNKVLMGINFFGNDYVLPRGGRAILGHEYLSLLAKYKPKISWEKQSKEHYFDYVQQSEQHRVFYPSLKSVSLRLQEARKWEAGLSIWEIGQGLESFFDLL